MHQPPIVIRWDPLSCSILGPRAICISMRGHGIDQPRPMEALRARARARRGVTCMSPTWMKDTVRHRKSHPASTSEPNTTQTHGSALHDGMPIHGCMSCRGQHKGRVGPVASSRKERRAGICNRVEDATSIYGSKKTKSKKSKQLCW